MNQSRVEHLVRQCALVRCPAELDGFRAQLKAQGEMAGDVMSAVVRREFELKGKAA